MEFDWDYVIWGNKLEDYVFAIGGALVATLITVVIMRIAAWRLRRWTKGQRNVPLLLFQHALEAARVWVILGLFLSIAAHRLFREPDIRPWLRTALVFFLTLQVLRSVTRALDAWRDSYDATVKLERSAHYTTLRMFLFFAKLALYVLGFIVVVDNLPGVEITALVAGLGIGGIAVALALQSILTDIFASLTITLDKPFVLGDFIIVGDLLGSVENIGLKTTRIRSLSGEQLIFSNSDLLSSRIRNYKRMHERRVPFEISVTYDTPQAKLRAIPDRMKEIIENTPETRFDRAHFKAFGASSLNFEIVYYVVSPDYNLFMDCQQTINLAIMDFFESEGIEFAYPTQTLFLHGDLPAGIPGMDRGGDGNDAPQDSQGDPASQPVSPA